MEIPHFVRDDTCEDASRESSRCDTISECSNKDNLLPLLFPLPDFLGL